MFAKNQFQILFAYHWQIRSRLLVTASQLSEPDINHNPGYGHGSIRELFFHLLRTENRWRLGLETGLQLPGLQPNNYSSLAEIQAEVDREQKAWQTLLERMSAEEIEGLVILTDRQGEISRMPRWRILTHLILHGMQHHSEVAQLLTARGKSPGDIDFILFGQGSQNLV